MDDLQQALAALGLSWGDVWRLVADRRAGTLVVVAGEQPGARATERRRVGDRGSRAAGLAAPG